MSKVGTWFLLVHVTSLDRIWPKLNLPTGAYGEKCIFGCLEVYKPFFYVKGPFFFSDKVWNLIIDYLGTKKMGVTLQKMVICYLILLIDLDPGL